ncbi:MAG: uroporphyrinogen-III synthase [Bacteroidota bacterium]
MVSVFVSRELSPESSLRTWLTEQGWTWYAQSLLRFESVDFNLPDQPLDWVFFYSSKAVSFWAHRQPKLGGQVKFAALGPGTAKTMTDYQIPVDFRGKGTPEQVALAFLSVAQRQRVLFPRAEESRRSVERALGGQIMASDLIVYRNQPAPRTDLVPTDIVILTSPLNVRSYFSSTNINPKATFLAIGPTTAAALTAYDMEAHYPEQPGEEGLVALLQEL